MTANLQVHHNEEEIQIVQFRNDSYYWQKELAFINEEIEFYLDVLNSSSIKKSMSKAVEAHDLIHQFNNLKETNEKYQLKCEVFRNRLEGQSECDEVECDYAYVKAHFTFRSKIEKHLNNVRKVKQSAFIYLRNRIGKVHIE
ncbi:hypothetical protein NE848_15740 [Gramella jeungdoensis]|uniref:Uncharacterized protein n=1 Tax=Gramella jeungdoensis TaxID=708091 RepID=A0ABT0Z547_9FLAO|nr:hypothetical protein [Gramella jeungdoensis]MCM8570848.1 hypothetical protein [Gramella jeungdoensis]